MQVTLTAWIIFGAGSVFGFALAAIAAVAVVQWVNRSDQHRLVDHIHSAYDLGWNHGDQGRRKRTAERGA